MNDILDFLKLAADATRLNILGLLAQQPRSGDELAAILNVKPSTVSHHVLRLQEAGLIAVTAQQYYKIYALNPGALQRYVSLLTPEQLAQRVDCAETVDAHAYAAQILSRWVQDGRLEGIPRKVQHKRIVFQWLIDKFQRDQRYDEAQVWERMDEWCHPHYVTEVIRLLVNDNHLNRLRDGSWYWRADSPRTQQAGFDPKQLPIAQTPDPLKYTATRAALRARDPDGDYANLKEKEHAPNLDRERRLIVFRLKRNQRYTAEEVDATIETYRRDLEGEAADICGELLAAGLLHQDADGRYWRDEIQWHSELETA